MRISAKHARAAGLPKCVQDAIRRGGIVSEPAERGKPEHEAQARFFREIAWQRLYDDVVCFSIPNGGYRHPRVAEEMAAEGVEAGALDIFALRRKRVHFLEMKRPRDEKGREVGKLSPAQVRMKARLEAAGALCAVAHGFDEAVAQFTAWDLIDPSKTEIAMPIGWDMMKIVDLKEWIQRQARRTA